jgi:hypothetical protein
MVFEDDEIERSRIDAQTGSTKAQQDAAAKRRVIAEFKKKMRQAKKAKDRRGYERLLELQNVRRKTLNGMLFGSGFTPTKLELFDGLESDFLLFGWQLLKAPVSYFR